MHHKDQTLTRDFLRFDAITNGYDLMEFFQENFPDSIALIGKERLIEDYFNTRPAPLISVKVMSTKWPANCN